MRLRCEDAWPLPQKTLLGQERKLASDRFAVGYVDARGADVGRRWTHIPPVGGGRHRRLQESRMLDEVARKLRPTTSHGTLRSRTAALSWTARIHLVGDEFSRAGMGVVVSYRQYRSACHGKDHRDRTWQPPRMLLRIHRRWRAVPRAWLGLFASRSGRRAARNLRSGRSDIRDHVQRW